MQYALMIYTDPGYGDALPEAERDAIHAEFRALLDDARVVEARGCSLPRRRPTCAWSAAGR